MEFIEVKENNLKDFKYGADVLNVVKGCDFIIDGVYKDIDILSKNWKEYYGALADNVIHVQKGLSKPGKIRWDYKIEIAHVTKTHFVLIYFNEDVVNHQTISSINMSSDGHVSIYAINKPRKNLKIEEMFLLKEKE